MKDTLMGYTWVANDGVHGDLQQVATRAHVFAFTKAHLAQHGANVRLQPPS